MCSLHYTLLLVCVWAQLSKNPVIVPVSHSHMCFPSLLGWQSHICAADHGGVCPQAGHQAADQRSAQPGVEGFSQRGGFHHDGIHLSHTHGAASPHGAKSQVQYIHTNLMTLICSGISLNTWLKSADFLNPFLFNFYDKIPRHTESKDNMKINF